VVFKVVGGERPLKPAAAPEHGLSDEVWKILEDCWQTQRTLRPSVKDVLNRVKLAASTCGTLSSVGDVSQRHEDPDSDFNKFDNLFVGVPNDDEDVGVYPEWTPEPYSSSSLTNFLLAMDRPPSQGSTLTDTSAHDSLFSKLSEAESSITESDQTSIDALVPDVHSKGGSTDTLPDFPPGPASDNASNFLATTGPVSRSPTPGEVIGHDPFATTPIHTGTRGL